MTETTAAATPSKPLWLRLLPLGIIVLGLALFFALGGPQYVSMDYLREQRGTLKGFVENYAVLTALAFITLYAVMTAISVPGASIMTIVGGFLFGTFFGGGLVVIGATIGACVLFLAVRYAFRDLVKDKLGGKMLSKFENGLKENELSYLFILRLVPIFPFFVVNVAPAFFDVKFRNYAITTLFGIIPGSLVYASVGNGIGAIFDRGEDANLSGLMLQPSVIGPIVGLIALSLIPVFYKKIKGSPAEPAT